MKYQWQARSDLPGTAAHQIRAGTPRSLCGMLLGQGTWSDDTMLLACRKRCRSCERRLKLAKYWMTALLPGSTDGKDGP